MLPGRRVRLAGGRRVGDAREAARCSSSPPGWPTPSAIGVRYGIPGAGELLDHAMASLIVLHADTEHGGWLSEPGTVTRKATYDHVHVGLASSAALTVGHPAAAALLDQVADVVEHPALGRAEPRRCSSRSRPTGRTPRTTAAPTPTCTASRRSSRWGTPRGMPCGTSAASRSPTASSTALRASGTGCCPSTSPPTGRCCPTTTATSRLHPFRPYGATFGHSLEWSRFLLQLDASPLVGSPDWLVEAADGLTRRALDGGWALDGRPGLVYTVDWDGAPVADVRLHWPVCEGIQATRGAPAAHRRPALGGLVPPALGPRRPLVHRRARHLAQRARRRHARGGHGLARPTRTSTTAAARSRPARGLTGRRLRPARRARRAQPARRGRRGPPPAGRVRRRQHLNRGLRSSHRAR